MKKIWICLFLSCLLIGCKGVDGDIPSQEEVFSFVREQVPTEQYELIDQEIESDSPKKEVYTFQSTERDLIFHATSTLSQIGIDATQTSYYHDQISCDYNMVIQALYKEDIEAIFQSCPLYVESKKWLNITNEEEILLASEYISLASELVTIEREYNSDAYLKEHPIYKIHCVTFTTEDYKHWDNIGTISINGISSQEEILEKLQTLYEEKKSS